MKNLMLLLASVMPTESIIEIIEKDLAAYKADPTPENIKKLTCTAMLLASKEVVAASDGGVEKVIKDMDRMHDGYELLTPKIG